VDVCSITDIPSVIESDMQQNLQRLLSTACLGDRVHDVVFQVRATSHIYLLLHNAVVEEGTFAAAVESVNNCSTAQ